MRITWYIVELILNVLKESGSKINLDKCELFQSKISYLGYDLDGKYITVDKSGLEVIRNYPVPKNIRALRGVLDIINYYKRFIPHLAKKPEFYINY